MSNRITKSKLNMILPFLVKRENIIPEEDTTIGTLTGSYISNSFTYSSSIDSITNLYATYSYGLGVTNQPIVIIMHGWNESATDYVSVINNIVSNKCFCCAVGLRSKNGASGTKDASGREIMDIYDAIQYIISNFPTIVNPNKINIVGFSGGGGNVYGSITKFPNLFNNAISYFGMSDYGYDPTYGWRYTNAAGYQVSIDAAVGGSPATHLNNFNSRYAVGAINNFKGKLRIYHDDQDSAVSVEQSRQVYSNFTAQSRLVYNESGVGDPIRYLHGLGTDVMNSLNDFKNDILIKNKPSIGNSGILRINGYCITDRFDIRLGNLDNHVSNLTYNLSSKTFTMTPLTGSQLATIIYNGVTQSQTINSVTTFQF